MAIGTAACAEINAAVRKAGLTLMVGHVLRYFEPFCTITRLAREGFFGKAYHADVWRLERDYLRLAGWKARRTSSGGYLYEVGAHELDWLRQLFGEPGVVHALVRKELSSENEIEDRVAVQIGFETGALGSYLGGAGFPHQDHGFCLRFERATLRSAQAFDPRALNIAGMVRPVELTFSSEDPFEAEMRDWLTCLSEGKPMTITGEDAAKTVALIEAAYASAEWDHLR